MSIEAVTEAEETCTLRTEQEMTGTHTLLRGETNKVLGDGVRVREVESLGEGCTTEGNGTLRQGGSPTGKGDQCDQCKFGKRQEVEGEGDDGSMDGHPNILPSNILGGHF
ncbi:hypothetical protein Tco_1191409 [Tanacetum coccineum]